MHLWRKPAERGLAESAHDARRSIDSIEKTVENVAGRVTSDAVELTIPGIVGLVVGCAVSVGMQTLEYLRRKFLDYRDNKLKRRRFQLNYGHMWATSMIGFVVSLFHSGNYDTPIPWKWYCGLTIPIAGFLAYLEPESFYVNN